VAVNLHATHYRFGINELAESTHGWHAALDANPAQGVIANDTTFLLRFTVQETGGTAAGNTDQQFQRNLNGAGWVDITTVSSVVKAVTTAVFANGADLTNRLTGTGTFESSGDGGTHDGLSGGIQNDIAASGNSETECALQIIGADVASGATIQFRLTSPDFTITNDVVPTIISQVESQTIAVGQSAETDSAQAVAWAPKRRLAGPAANIISIFQSSIGLSSNLRCERRFNITLNRLVWRTSSTPSTVSNSSFGYSLSLSSPEYSRERMSDGYIGYLCAHGKKRFAICRKLAWLAG